MVDKKNWINFAGERIDLNMIPKEGLKLSNLSEGARNVLSIFDTDSHK